MQNVLGGNELSWKWSGHCAQKANTKTKNRCASHHWRGHLQLLIASATIKYYRIFISTLACHLVTYLTNWMPREGIKQKAPINKWQFIYIFRAMMVNDFKEWLTKKKERIVSTQDDRTKLKYNKSIFNGTRERVTAFHRDLFKTNRVLSAPPLVVWHLFHLSRDKVNEHAENEQQIYQPWKLPPSETTI